MERPVYGDRNWPRDFPGWMYLGTLIHLLNHAMHPDAEPDDVVLIRSFEDRDAPFDVPVLVSPEDDPQAERRAGIARTVALEALRDGAINPAWLDSRGTFHPVSPEAWRDGASDGDLTAILVRATLPKDLIADNDNVGFGDAPSLYVSVSEATALLAHFQERVRLPLSPSRVLEGLGASAVAPDALWPLAAAVVWAATRNLSLARGAHRYDEEMSQRSFAKARGRALEHLARDEIAYHSCVCYRRVCRCWDYALREIVSHAKVGAIVARGFKNDSGNQIAVPEGAWSGSVEFREYATLASPTCDGDHWTRIEFVAEKLMKVLLPPATLPVCAGELALSEINPAATAPTVRANVEAVTLALFRDRIVSGVTLESQGGEAGAIWEVWRGPVRRPKERRIYDSLAHRHGLLRFRAGKLDPESTSPVLAAIEDTIGAFKP